MLPRLSIDPRLEQGEVEALVKLLDTDEKRRLALQLVVAWDISRATGETCDSLLELRRLADALFSASGESGSAQRLIAATHYARTLALEAGEAASGAALRARCFDLARHCSVDVARIRRELLWSTDDVVFRTRASQLEGPAPDKSL